MWRRPCLLSSGSLTKDSSSSVKPVPTLNFAASCVIVSLPIGSCNTQGMGMNINTASNLCSYELSQGMFPTLLLWLAICSLSNLGKWHALEMTVLFKRKLAVQGVCGGKSAIRNKCFPRKKLTKRLIMAFPWGVGMAFPLLQNCGWALPRVEILFKNKFRWRHTGREG